MEVIFSQYRIDQVGVRVRVQVMVHVRQLGFEANFHQYSAIVMITNNANNHVYHVHYQGSHDEIISI